MLNENLNEQFHLPFFPDRMQSVQNFSDVGQTWEKTCVFVIYQKKNLLKDILKMCKWKLTSP